MAKEPLKRAKLESFWNVALEKVYLYSPPSRQGTQAISDSPRPGLEMLLGGDGVGEGQVRPWPAGQGPCVPSGLSPGWGSKIWAFVLYTQG